MKLTFIGADHEVTGSCHLLSACGKNILIDYGMEQGKDYFENVPIPVSAPEIDYVFLTHAHVDILQRFQGKNIFNRRDLRSVQHNAQRLRSYPDAGSRMAQQKSQTKQRYNAD